MEELRIPNEIFSFPRGNKQYYDILLVYREMSSELGGSDGGKTTVVEDNKSTEIFGDFRGDREKKTIL